MPQLPTNSSFSNVKTLYLPSTLKQADGSETLEEQKAWVKLDVGENMVADLESLNDADKNSTVSRLRILASRIKEWNYVNAENIPEPITFENVCQLNPDDIAFLIKEQNAGAQAGATQPLSLDDKKK